jgi:Fic family protein
MHDPIWIWQHPGWPHFDWNAELIAPLLRACAQAQGRLLGVTSVVDSDTDTLNRLNAMLENIITSSAIEGEQLNAGSVRSSLARRLGLADSGKPSPRSEGLAALLMDATAGQDSPLTQERLFTWHSWLFVEDGASLSNHLYIGQLRGEEPMQVVSGRLDRPVVHFEAPPRDGLEQQIAEFLTWFASSRDDTSLDPFVRAGIAHFWFVTLHPFDDGNGRLTRTITDMALAQSDQQTIRLYAMSASILEDRTTYYRVLEASQKATPDITAWLMWFLQTLLRSLEQALVRIDRVIAKARFWQIHRNDDLSGEQIKVLNRLLDGGERGFEGGINAAQYQAAAKVSKATATRHLSDLLSKGCITRMAGGGRSTRYCIAPSDAK